MSVNGRLYDWESLTVNLAGKQDIAGITDIEYSDERIIKERYGKGSIARGTGRGNYKASGSLTLDRDEFKRFTDEIEGKIYNSEFNIICSYGDDDQDVITDTLSTCQIIKMSTNAKQGEDNAGAVKLDFKILKPIKWNDVEPI